MLAKSSKYSRRRVWFLEFIKSEIYLYIESSVVAYPPFVAAEREGAASWNTDLAPIL